jgi:hypothetical protein
MATTQTRSSPASGLPYYVWEVAGKPVSIQLYYDVIDRMQPDILRGLGALRRRGAEVGGILLGRPDPEFSGRVIIEDFETVPTEYLNGPSYNLSPKDLAGFEAAVARHSRTDAGPVPVGFYRSHTRDELYMDDADLALAQRFFPGEGHVFLLIKPYASRPSLGGFFFWEDGAINRESTYLQFPFNRSELGGGEARPVAEAPRPEGERPLPPYTPAAELPRSHTLDFNPPDPPFSADLRSNLSILSAPPERSRRPAISLLQWLLAAFVVAAAAAGVFAYRDLAAPKQARPAVVDETALPLKLSVAEQQNQLDVTWDRSSPVVMKAKRGLLAISDGDNKRDLELTGAQLRTGRVLYSRLSADVGLRLEVYGEGSKPVTESIRIVSTEAPRSPIERPKTERKKELAKELSREPLASPPVASPPVERKAASRPPEPAAIPAAKPPAAVRRAAAAATERPRTEPVSPAPKAETPSVEAPPPEIELQRPARRR